MLGASLDRYSLTSDGIPFPPRPCFNWLPQYRYGLFAYKALQEACAARLTRGGNALSFAPGNRGAPEVPVHLVRPVLTDAVLRRDGWLGYVLGQAEGSLEPFATGEFFHPLTADVALIVAKEDGSGVLLNNILSYMIPAPQSLEATLALAGGYAGASQDEIAAGHERRKAGAGKLNATLRETYGIDDPALLRLHSAGVGGLIEAATRYMHVIKPGYRTCILVPEYWDLLRCVLTYSPSNISIVEGRERPDFPKQAWIEAIGRPDVDFAYISYTNNPLGTTVPLDTMMEAIDALRDDALFFIDCTSVDTEESSGAESIARILRTFSQKNLLITKSFSKEYNKGHIRVGYGLFTRREVAESLWPFMAAYSPAAITAEALGALADGTAHVLKAYRRIGADLRAFARSHPDIRVTGTTSNYTSLFFESEDACSRAQAAIAAAYGDQVFPGELPMQGGGRLGLGQGEVSLTSMKRIPFLPENALRLLVTETSVRQVHEAL